MSSAKPGIGAKIQMDPNGASSYVTIGEVTRITGPGLTSEALEATHLQSPNETAEYIKGKIDSGECTLEMNFLPDDSSQKNFIAAVKQLSAADNPSFNIVWTGGGTFSFVGIATGYEPTAAEDGKMEATGTIKITGVLTTPT